MRVIGIDAGATKTECLLADENGEILAKTRGPGTNFQLFAEDEVEFVLANLLEQVLAETSKPADALCIGIAGAGRRRDESVMQRILRRIDLAREHFVTNDALIALVAGAKQRYGVVLIVGTGSTAYGVNQDGEVARSGGWGPLLGDEGSAYWMGLRMLHSVVRAEDGRAQPTLLRKRVLERLHLEDVDSLVHQVYRELARAEIAALAPIIQEVADLGDDAAQAIIDDAVREFVRAAESVIGRLKLAGESFRLVLSGGMWKAVPVLRQDFERIIKKVAPWVSVIELDVEPARGAVQLALERASLAAAKRQAL